MKARHFAISFSHLMVLLLATSTLPAQPAPAASRPSAPLGLLRLQNSSKPGQAPAIAAAKFSVDDLAAGVAAGAAKSRKDEVDVLSLDANANDIDDAFERQKRGALLPTTASTGERQALAQE